MNRIKKCNKVNFFFLRDIGKCLIKINYEKMVKEKLKEPWEESMITEVEFLEWIYISFVFCSTAPWKKNAKADCTFLTDLLKCNHRTRVCYTMCPVITLSTIYVKNKQLFLQQGNACVSFHFPTRFDMTTAR